MRSLTPKTIAIASILAIVPLAGAHAEWDPGAPTMTDTAHGPRLPSVVNQVTGVRQGIADAQRDNQINATQAHKLNARADRIERTAERVAATDHGKIPSSRYHQLMRQLDNVNARLQDQNSGFPTKDDNSGSIFNG